MQKNLGLNEWIESLISHSKILLSGDWNITPLQGDASCRQYYRLVDSKSCWILVSSPLERIDNNIFVSIAKHWRDLGVNVPEIVQIDSVKGYMLIEDFGELHLFDCSREAIDLHLYRQSIAQLHKIQAVPAIKLPVFDEFFLLRELKLFDTWFVKRFLQLETPQLLADVNALLVKTALEQPQVTMHRDFHCRNLLVNDNQMGVIDFQDAVIGPISYDLASLLKDCYITHSEEQIEMLMDEYLLVLNDSELVDKKITKEAFMVWFDLIALQRHLKVLGLFIRLAVDEGKSAYLADLPRVFSYVLAVTAKYKELHSFNRWLNEQALPVLNRQHWEKQ